MCLGPLASLMRRGSAFSHQESHHGQVQCVEGGSQHSAGYSRPDCMEVPRLKSISVETTTVKAEPVDERSPTPRFTPDLPIVPIIEQPFDERSVTPHFDQRSVTPRSATLTHAERGPVDDRSVTPDFVSEASVKVEEVSSDDGSDHSFEQQPNGFYQAVHLAPVPMPVGLFDAIGPRPAQYGPPCRSSCCGGVSTLRWTGPNNPNGNAGRPYYKCSSCDSWVTWADLRGISEGNPSCDCDRPSRETVAGVNSSRPGASFYTCADGRCRYWAWES